MPFLKHATRIKRFARDTTGAVVVEYALALAMIGGGLAVFAESTGASVREVGEEMAAGLARAEGPDSNGPSGAASHDCANDLSLAAISSNAPADPLWWRMTPLVMAAATLLLLFAMNKCKRPAADVEPEKERAAVPDEQLFAKRQQILRLLKNDMSAVFEGRITAGHIMSRRLSTVAPTATIDEVRHLMKTQKIRHMLVRGGAGELLGIISDRNVRGSQDTTAAELMTADPLTIESSATLDPAVTLLIKRQMSCLPVVDAGKLVGLLTSTDLLMTLQCVSQTLKQLANEMAPPAEQA